MKLYICRRLKWILTKDQWLITILLGVAVLPILVSCNSPSSPTNIQPGSIEVSGGGDELGIVVDENMQVLHVEPDWPAAVAGVQVGDVLDSVEGISFAKDKSKAKDVIRESKKNKKLKLKVKRDHKDVDIDISSFQLPSGTNLPTVTPVWPPQDYF